MRVIAGIAKGRKLKSGKGLKARPTSDRIKESLFNMISPSLPGAVFLDLFSGFGGIGIEAISRGAQKVFFVEQDRKHLKIITENLHLTKFEDYAQVISGDVLHVLPKLRLCFDIIYLDPPYMETSLYEKTIEIIDQYRLLKQTGIIICEHDQELPGKIFSLFSVIQEKRYGDIRLTFLNSLERGEE